MVIISKPLALKFYALMLCLSATSICYGQQKWELLTDTLQDVVKMRFVSFDTGYLLIRDSASNTSLLRTVDSGYSFQSVSLPLESNKSNVIRDIECSGSYVWIAVNGRSSISHLPVTLLKSTDAGLTWLPITLDTMLHVSEIAFWDRANGYFLGYKDSTFQGKPSAFSKMGYSSDGGNSWVSRPLPDGHEFASLRLGEEGTIVEHSSASEPNLSDDFVSTDFGRSWSYRSHLMGNYAGRGTWLSSVGWSTDLGLSWQASNIFPFGPRTLEAIYCDTIGDAIVSSADYKISPKIYASSDFGRSWDSAIVPFPIISSAAIFDALHMYVSASNQDGTRRSSLYRQPRTKSGVTGQLVKASGLFSIFPNPVNKEASVKFTLTERCNVTLEIFDMLGRKIQTLVNGLMDAGSHGARFDAANLPNGIYTAQITFGGLHREVKMLLSK